MMNNAKRLVRSMLRWGLAGGVASSVIQLISQHSLVMDSECHLPRTVCSFLEWCIVGLVLALIPPDEKPAK
jgi:hypothetical protein